MNEDSRDRQSGYRHGPQTGGGGNADDKNASIFSEGLAMSSSSNGQVGPRPMLERLANQKAGVGEAGTVHGGNVRPPSAQPPMDRPPDHVVCLRELTNRNVSY